MTPTPEQIAAAVERLKWARQRPLEIDADMPQDLEDVGIILEALAAAQADTATMTKDLVKYRLALNRIAHPVTYATTDADPREIARRALLLGCQVDPLPDCYLRRAAISAAAGGRGEAFMKTGIEYIEQERYRQMDIEGFGSKHDDAHTGCQLLAAARCYACAAHEQLAGLTEATHQPGIPPLEWPWEASWWKPKECPMQNLVMAGALIAAEIDRLQRAEGAEEGRTK